MTMAVGGLALHWGGACNRFSEEDLRLQSMYGLADRLAARVEELERYYCEAERRLNVSGEPSPHPEDRRSAPYPQGPIPLSYNLQILKTWAEQSGVKFSPLPMARNLTPFGGRGSCCVYDTCGEVCPSGARYSPDFTFRQLIAPKKIVLHDRTLVRRLILDDSDRRSSPRRRFASGSARRSGRIPREDVRRRVRLLLELASAAAVGELAVSERRREPLGPGRPLHERPQIHLRRRRTSTIRRFPART